MTNLESIRVLISGSWLVFFLFLISFVAFSFFIYRFTLPKINPRLKLLLTFIRALALILILFLIFEPVISSLFQFTNKQHTYIFIDKSNSIAAKDSANRTEQINSFVNYLRSQSQLDIKTFSFANKLDSLDENGLESLKLDGIQSNFANIAGLISKKQLNIASAIILSDGIITEGIDPTFQLEKMQIPIFTVGIGDTASKKDIEVLAISNNKFVYAGKETKIEASIKNLGYSNRIVRAVLKDEDKVIDTKDITLNNSGFNKVQFSFTPINGGEKKLTLSVNSLEGESTFINNSKSVFIDVLTTKINIALIAGSPSSDVSAISNALSFDKNIYVQKMIHVAGNKFWDNEKNNNLDSAKVFFLINFPTFNTPQQIVDQVFSKLERMNKPFFILISPFTDLTRLRNFNRILPVSINNTSQESILVQPEIQSQEFSSSFTQIGNSISIWNNLPPVNQVNIEITAKPESKVIVRSRVRDILLGNPLAVIRSIGNQRSFLINASGIWSWSLQNAEKNPEFFNNFINEIVKWLSLNSNKKQFSVSTNKKVYSPGEQVEFIAELYDNSFNTIDTASVSVNIKSNLDEYDISMNRLGKGLYNGFFTPLTKGDYSFSGKVQLNGDAKFSNESRLLVNNTSLEKADTKMRIDFLKQLAVFTGGNYYPVDNYSSIKQNLLNQIKLRSKNTYINSELDLRNNFMILALVIFLFGLEWLLRKRSGLL